jgi:hypothetical protein
VTVDLAPNRIPPQDGALRLGGQRREHDPLTDRALRLLGDFELYRPPE